MGASILGQILRATVINSGSGSAWSGVLMIKKERLAPQERERMDVTREKIWVELILPVLSTMNTWYVGGWCVLMLVWDQAPESQIGGLPRT